MSTNETTVDDLRQAFARGELSPEELRERLAELSENTDREELWLRWAEQGLFEAPIEQEGYTSFAGGRVREVNPDGER